MSGTIAIRPYSIILILMVGFCLLLNGGYAATRHTLILTLEDYGHDLRVLELLPTGEIITTGQSFFLSNLYVDDEQIAVSPNSRFVWVGATDSSNNSILKQFAISSEGRLSTTARTIEGSGYYTKFTPNGQMLFLGSSCPIYRAYPDGSVESTANIYGTGGHISPRGDIDLVLANPVYVFRIDYSGFSVYNIQSVNVAVGATSYDAVYTPEGDYVVIIYGIGGVGHDNVAIYPILTDGMLDTTQVQRFNAGAGVGSAAMTPDGKYLYCGAWDDFQIAILRRTYTGTGPYEDTGIRVPVIYWPWQMIVSPDGKYLVWYGNEYVDDGIIGSYAIQDDGNLVPVYQFPFAATFGNNPIYFQFAYPEAATAVEPREWQLFE